MTKRLFDFSCSLLALILLSPLMILIAFWIKIDSPGHVFFRQERIGRFAKPFMIFKFRTMFFDAKQQSELTIGKDARITKAGYFLRKSKLDELPQLFDVLRGTMSLVGPRPEVSRYIEHYPAEYRQKILSIRPGITDWAAICMIDENELLADSSNPEQYYIKIILPQKIEHYIKYVDQHSLMGDLHIIMATLKKIITR